MALFVPAGELLLAQLAAGAGCGIAAGLGLSGLLSWRSCSPEPEQASRADSTTGSHDVAEGVSLAAEEMPLLRRFTDRLRNPPAAEARRGRGS